MICRYCGHTIDEHRAGFFNPCLTCGQNEDGSDICPDFEAEPEEEEDDE